MTDSDFHRSAESHDEIGKQARELLALEYERGGRQGSYSTYAELARTGSGEFTLCSIRAVEAGLRLAGTAAHLAQEPARPSAWICTSRTEVFVTQDHDAVRAFMDSENGWTVVPLYMSSRIPTAAQPAAKPIAWMNREHIGAYMAGTPRGLAWASPEQTEFYDVALYAAQPPAAPVEKEFKSAEALADWLERAPRKMFKFGDGEREIVEPSYLLGTDVDALISMLRVPSHHQSCSAGNARAQELADYIEQSTPPTYMDDVMLDRADREIVIAALRHMTGGPQAAPDRGEVAAAAIDLTEKGVLSEYYSGRINGDNRIREGFKNLRSALSLSRPQSRTGEV